jgi:hypothetical protein
VNEVLNWIGGSPSKYGLYDYPECEYCTTAPSCDDCCKTARAMLYCDRGNGVYVPVEGEKE